MSDCRDFTEDEVIYVIVLSVVSAFLTCCFIFWIILCCFVMHKNSKGTKDVIGKRREDRFGSQGINLVTSPQPIEFGETRPLESPVKTETFSRAKGREVANALQQKEAQDNHYENPPIQDTNLLKTGAVNSIEKSITFDTFMQPKKSKGQLDEIPMEPLNTETIPNPTYESSPEIIKDLDSLPLVQESPVRKSSKTDLTRKGSMPGHEVTIVHDGVSKKEGVYDYLDKK